MTSLEGDVSRIQWRVASRLGRRSRQRPSRAYKPPPPSPSQPPIWAPVRMETLFKTGTICTQLRPLIDSKLIKLTSNPTRPRTQFACQRNCSGEKTRQTNVHETPDAGIGERVPL